MSESLYTRCPIGTHQEHRASMTSPTAQMKPHAIAVLWCRTTHCASCGTLCHSHPHSPELIHPLIILILGVVACDVIIIIMRSILIDRFFLCFVSCRSFEVLSTDTTMQSTLSQTPISQIPSVRNVKRGRFDQSRSRNHNQDTSTDPDLNANANPYSNLNPNRKANASPNDKHQNLENVNCKSVKGILSSPNNPATARRLSRRDPCSVSWHKRVVVHRVPRSDASRSMFVAESASQEGLSSQCCVIV